MAKGHSIHIGLNFVDPKHYSGWDGQLSACLNDARELAFIANSMNYESVELITNENATREVIIERITKESQILQKGDTLLITYAGHGGQIPDLDGDEEDGKDETWCLFNGQLIDDELHKLWTLFEDGVRIWIITDSCHSGTLIRGNYNEVQLLSQSKRAMPRAVCLSTYKENEAFYNTVLNLVSGTENASDIKATVRLFAACMDNQYASDGDSNGLFTGTILQVWDKGNFAGNYRKFYKSILELMPPNESPQHRISGNPDLIWDEMKPFAIM